MSYLQCPVRVALQMKRMSLSHCTSQCGHTVTVQKYLIRSWLFNKFLNQVHPVAKLASWIQNIWLSKQVQFFPSKTQECLMKLENMQHAEKGVFDL